MDRAKEWVIQWRTGTNVKGDSQLEKSKLFLISQGRNSREVP